MIDVDQSLKEFLEEHEEKGQSLGKIGSPVTIICPSGKRCTDVLRSISDWTKEKDGQTAKLFAKHFKLAEQIERLKKGYYLVATRLGCTRLG